MRRALLAWAVLLAACPLPVIKPTPDGFTIEPASARADPGTVLKLVAAQAAPPITWSAAGGGSVGPDGSFVAPGCSSPLPATVTITATSGGFTATAVITVEDRVTGITISPAAVVLAPGATQLFKATVKSICNPGGVASTVKLRRPADPNKPVEVVRPGV